ncbi:MAG: 3-dehydroquinate dehydratase-2 [Bacteroidia bacterium]
MKILVINGPNLNLLGKREPELYGKQSLEALMDGLKKEFPDVLLTYFQSNIEGELIDEVQKADGKVDAVVLNAGGYTHTSVSIRDAIAGVVLPVVEVHMSNTAAREEFRQISLIAGVCKGSITGFGANSYSLAIKAITTYLKEAK